MYCVTEEEIGVMCSEAKDCQGLQATARSLREHDPVDTLIRIFSLQNCKRLISVVLSPQDVVICSAVLGN